MIILIILPQNGASFSQFGLDYGWTLCTQKSYAGEYNKSMIFMQWMVVGVAEKSCGLPFMRMESRTHLDFQKGVSCHPC